MTIEEIKQKTSLCFLLNPNIPEEEKSCVIEKVMATKATIVPKAALCNVITYILKQIAELKEKISILLSCKNCSENKSGWICVKEYENKCLAQKIEFIKELKKENVKLKEQNLKDCEAFNKTMKEIKEQWKKEHSQLTEAKELLNEFLRLHYNPIVDECTLFHKVEQFLDCFTVS